MSDDPKKPKPKPRPKPKGKQVRRGRPRKIGVIARPKDARPSKSPINTKPRIISTDLILPNGEIPSDQALRLKAAMVYTTDLNQCSLADLHEDPRFNHIPITVLRVWHKEDDWEGERKQFLKDFRRNSELKLHDELIQAQVGGLKRMQVLLDMSMEALVGNDAANPTTNLEMKSFETVGTLAVRLFETLNSAREKMIPLFVQHQTPQQKKPKAEKILPEMPKLSSAQARAGALAALRVKQEEQRRAHKAYLDSLKQGGKEDGGSEGED